MDEDDFNMDVYEEDDPATVLKSGGQNGSGSASSSSKVTKKASSKTSSAGSEPGHSTGMCLIPKCDEEQKKNCRWCVRHNRHHENRKYFEENNKTNGSKQRREEYTKQCKEDISFAIRSIEEEAANNAGVGRWGNSNKQYLTAQWTEKTGSELSAEDGKRRRPFEEEEYILRMMRKKGRLRDYWKEKWDEFDAVTQRRDTKGEGGSKRLWLFAGEWEDEKKRKYMDVGATVASELLKNPKADDVHALHMHVHDQSKATNFQHSFFQGGAGTPGGGRLGLLDGRGKADDNAGGNSEDDAEAVVKSDQHKVQEPPLKKLKGNIIKLRASFNDSLDANVTKVLGKHVSELLLKPQHLKNKQTKK